MTTADMMKTTSKIHGHCGYEDFEINGSVVRCIVALKRTPRGFAKPAYRWSINGKVASKAAVEAFLAS